jgi:hypothetical protein
MGLCKQCGEEKIFDGVEVGHDDDGGMRSDEVWVCPNECHQHGEHDCELCRKENQ